MDTESSSKYPNHFPVLSSQKKIWLHHSVVHNATIIPLPPCLPPQCFLQAMKGRKIRLESTTGAGAHAGSTREGGNLIPGPERGPPVMPWRGFFGAIPHRDVLMTQFCVQSSPPHCKVGSVERGWPDAHAQVYFCSSEDVGWMRRAR